MASSYLPPSRLRNGFAAFVRFTVTGIARKSHPHSHDAPMRERAAPHGADTPAIHLSEDIIMPAGGVRQSVFFLFATSRPFAQAGRPSRVSPLAPRRRSVSPALTAHWAVIHPRARFDSPLFCSMDLAKEKPQRLLRFGGGEGNRTPVRKSDCQAFSERSLRFNIPSPRRPQTGSRGQ